MYNKQHVHKLNLKSFNFIVPVRINHAANQNFLNITVIVPYGNYSMED